MQLDLMSQQYANFDIKMAWDITITESKTVIDGVISNIRYSKMQDVEIWVKYIDTDGRTVSRAVDLVTPNQLNMNDATEFRVVLQTIVPHGGKLVFIYKYYGYDGADGTRWMQSFESNAP